MRRIRLATGRRALFGALFVVSLLAFLPLRLALGWFGVETQGFIARTVTGSVWAGSVSEARFGEVELGDLDAGVRPLPLLIGRARIGVSSDAAPPNPRISGAMTVSRHAMGIDDVTALIPTGRAFAPLPITGLDLSDVSIRFRDDVCEAAEGRVRAMLSGEIQGVVLPAALSGAARCEAGALLLPLESQGGERADLRIWPDGRYRAELALPASDPAVAARLQLVGFVAAGSGYRLSVEGRF